MELADRLKLAELEAEVAMLKALIKKAMDIALEARYDNRPFQEIARTFKTTTPPPTMLPVDAPTLADFLSQDLGIGGVSTGNPTSEPVPQKKIKLSPYNLSSLTPKRNQSDNSTAFDDMLEPEDI